MEKAFGLKSGDIKLIDDPACAKLIENNAWTKYKNTLGEMIRFEAIRDSTFNIGYGKAIVTYGIPIIDFLSGRMYTENIVQGIFQALQCSVHLDYKIVGYVNENVRIVQRLMPTDSRDKKVCSIQSNYFRKNNFFDDPFVEGLKDLLL